MRYDALQLATLRLRNFDVAKFQGEKGISVDLENQKLSLTYLNFLCTILFPEIRFEQPCFLNEKEKILVLHYLLNSTGVRDIERWIGFKEIDSGYVYFPSMNSRVILPIVKNFGENPLKFVEISKTIGGKKSGLSEYSMQFPVFPKISAIFTLVPAESEFNAACSVLLQYTAKEIFDTEDIVVMCEEIAEKIISKL